MIDGILIIDSESGLPLYSKLQNVDDVLFGGFLSAIKSFIKELSLGVLSSFTTDKKHFILTAGVNKTTCLISSKNLDFKEVYSLALEISSDFKNFLVLNKREFLIISIRKFDVPLQEILNKETKNIPYMIQVVEFVKKEFRGNISYQPKIKNKDGKIIPVDLLIDNGKANSRTNGKLLSKFHKPFSRETTFIKVFNSTIGRAEVTQFIDSVKTLGLNSSDVEDPEIYGYFPKKVPIIVRDFSPTVLEEVGKLKRFKNKAYFTPSHKSEMMGHGHMKRKGICLVELWKWDDTTYPVRNFS